ncbi:hypothetical protein AB6A40_009471 [Gnathostoma spinigerum]|uniref:Protein-S-isoprenylcysteine O-methyltransferase n=1 Tax=Gnathostoma spinigerum TaxID=75299 RepID=A0ABD6F0W1_9BILA
MARSLLELTAFRIRHDLELRCSLACCFSSLFISCLTCLLSSWNVYAIAGSITLCISVCTALNGWKEKWNSSQAALLGSVFGTAFMCLCRSSNKLEILFFRYTLCLTFFHYSEYIATALTNRRNLRPSSYLLDQSLHYWIAAVSSWLEFSLESYFVPSIKSVSFSTFGVCLVICGESLRKVAMFQAKGSFTHTIATRKRSDHSLVTDGVYAFVRHPGYLGWFIWSVGTQIVLCNPVCVVSYAIVSWAFFEDRIFWEEQSLVAFFGESYIRYRAKVPCGVPFIRGYDISMVHSFGSSHL